MSDRAINLLIDQRVEGTQAVSQQRVEVTNLQASVKSLAQVYGVSSKELIRFNDYLNEETASGRSLERVLRDAASATSGFEKETRLLSRGLREGIDDTRKLEQETERLARTQEKAGLEMQKEFARRAQLAKQAEEQAQKAANQQSNKLLSATGAGLPGGSATSSLLGQFGGAEILGPVAGIAIGIAAIKKLATSMFDLVQHEGEAVRELANLGSRLGITTADAEHLSIAAKLTGVNISSLEMAARGLSAALDDPTGSGKKQADVLRKLQVGMVDAAGGERELGAVTLDTLNALAQIPDVAKRVHESQVLLGRGSKVLQPMIEDLPALKQAANELASSLNSGVNESLLKADRSVKELDISYELLKKNLAAVITPIVIPFVQTVTLKFKGDLAPTGSAAELGGQLVGGYIASAIEAGEQDKLDRRTQKLKKAVAETDKLIEAQKRLEKASQLPGLSPDKRSEFSNAHDAFNKLIESRRAADTELSKNSAEAPTGLIRYYHRQPPKDDSAKKALQDTLTSLNGPITSANALLEEAGKKAAERYSKGFAHTKEGVEQTIAGLKKSINEASAKLTAPQLDVLTVRPELEKQQKSDQSALKRSEAELKALNAAGQHQKVIDSEVLTLKEKLRSIQDGELTGLEKITAESESLLEKLRERKKLGSVGSAAYEEELKLIGQVKTAETDRYNQRVAIAEVQNKRKVGNTAFEVQRGVERDVLLGKAKIEEAQGKQSGDDEGGIEREKQLRLQLAQLDFQLAARQIQDLRAESAERERQVHDQIKLKAEQAAILQAQIKASGAAAKEVSDAQVQAELKLGVVEQRHRDESDKAAEDAIRRARILADLEAAKARAIAQGQSKLSIINAAPGFELQAELNADAKRLQLDREQAATNKARSDADIAKLQSQLAANPERAEGLNKQIDGLRVTAAQEASKIERDTIQAREDAEGKIAQKRRAEQQEFSKTFADGILAAQKGGNGSRAFGIGLGEKIEKQLLENLGGIAYRSGGQGIVKNLSVAKDPESFLGKLLAKTPFGPQANDSPVERQVAAVDKTTAAVNEVRDILAGKPLPGEGIAAGSSFGGPSGILSGLIPQLSKFGSDINGLTGQGGLKVPGVGFASKIVTDAVSAVSNPALRGRPDETALPKSISDAVKAATGVGVPGRDIAEKLNTDATDRNTRSIDDLSRALIAQARSAAQGGGNSSVSSDISSVADSLGDSSSGDSGGSDSGSSSSSSGPDSSSSSDGGGGGSDSGGGWDLGGGGDSPAISTSTTSVSQSSAQSGRNGTVDGNGLAGLFSGLGFTGDIRAIATGVSSKPDGSNAQTLSTPERFGAGAATIAAVATGVYQGVSQFEKGGARGDIAGTGALAGTAGALIGLAGVTGPAAPVLASIGAALGLISSFFGDPKQNRSKDISREVRDNFSPEPTALALNFDQAGHFYDYDSRGLARSSQFSNYPVAKRNSSIDRFNGQDYILPGEQFAPFENGPTIKPTGGSGQLGAPATPPAAPVTPPPAVIVNVSTMDAKSFRDNSSAIIDAVHYAVANNKGKAGDFVSELNQRMNGRA